MKVTLEKDDLIQILAEHFGSDFDAENITIRSDPFEIEVRNVPLPASEKATPQVPEPVVVRDLPITTSRVAADDVAVVMRRADADASVNPPPPGNDDSDISDVSGSPIALIQQSRELEERLRRDKTPRRRGGQATPPPYSSEET